ncbi:MAG: outer membrane beta-barrel protein [Parasphingorhabdus sp.]|uniref:outer membrane beta-barrel protein n=1 Tax=Parasphingorhabdus sp. TaxID=2709688 RepID=UPI00300349EB
MLVESHVAFAQQSILTEPEDVAGNRSQPDYDPMGIKLGSFVLRPTLSISPDFNSNIFTQKDDAKSDASVTITPTITAALKRPGQSFAVTGRMKARRYANFNGQNYEEYRLDTSGFAELPEAITLAANVGWSESTTSRGSFENDLQIGSPLKKRDFSSSLFLKKRFNRLSIDGAFTASKFTYGDVRLDSGVVIDQGFRDGHRIGGRVGAAFGISPLLSFQVKGSYDSFDYNEPRALFDRDAHSYSLTAGLRYELTRLLVAEINAGLRRHKFKNSTFPDIEGLALSAQLRWYPTPLVSVRMDLDQSTTTSSFDSVSAVTVTNFKLGADYEYRRNVVLSAEIQGSLEEYQGIEAAAKRVSITGRAEWKLNRRFSLRGYSSFDIRTGSGSPLVPSYNAFKAGGSVVLAI